MSIHEKENELIFESMYSKQKQINESDFEEGEDYFEKDRKNPNKIFFERNEWYDFLKLLETKGFENNKRSAEYYKWNQYTIQVRLINPTSAEDPDAGVCDGFSLELFFDNEKLSHKDKTKTFDSLEDLKSETLKLLKTLNFDIESEYYSTI